MGRSSVFFAMAPRFKLLIFLWLVAACLGGTTATGEDGAAPTTEKPATVTSEKPATVTSEKPATVTSEKPATVTSEKPATVTSEKPATVTSEKPATVTSEKPATVTSEKPATVTSEKPATGTTEKPATGTTEKPATGTTEKPATGTTEKPATGTTEKPATGTTEKPATGTTEKPATGTTEKPATGTTEKPATGTTGSSTASTASPDPCTPNPCGQGSTCDPRDGKNFVCLCLADESYNNNSGSCEKAKVFPGELTVPGITFKEAMTNKKSPEFREAAKNITDDLDKAFADNKDYTGSIVLEIKEAASRGSKASGVNAVVDITFKSNAQITTEEVENSVKECTVCDLETFNSRNLCDGNTGCDNITTTCKSKDGTFDCLCIENVYVKTNLSDKLCIACPSGEKAVGDKCEACGFGQSGLNCNESWKLILTIVGTVLGGLLLVTLILLILVASKPKKRSKKNKNGDIGDPYVSKSPAKTPLVNDNFANGQAPAANRSAGVPRIPRATSGWENRNFEMTQSNSRQNTGFGGSSRVIEDDDDMAPYAQSRPQSSLYGQARAQNNPYGRNPYASNQGQTNPYFVNDDGRRYN